MTVVLILFYYTKYRLTSLKTNWHLFYISPSRTGRTTVTIQVTDLNDLCPKFVSSVYLGSMSVEDNYVQATSGMDRLVLMATDEDVMVRKEHRAAIFCDFCYWY